MVFGTIRFMEEEMITDSRAVEKALNDPLRRSRRLNNYTCDDLLKDLKKDWSDGE